MPKQTLYDLLGVEQQAPAAEIKSQYRRLAKRYHPDLNPGNPQAEQQFREVQAAYEVLSDSEKRRQYDTQIGAEPVEFATGRRWQTGPRSYRRYDARARQRPRPTRPYTKPNKPRAAYNHYTVEVSLTELFKGARRTLTIGQTFTCGRCRGRGRLEEGQICDRCDGYGFLVNYRVIDVLIPPGLHPGMNIRLSVDSDQPEHPLLDAPIATNISVTIYLRESKPFEYYNDQLHITVKVPGALLHEGGEWTIPAPEGGEMTFKIPAGLTSGTTLTLRRRGLRNGASQRRGNLLCTVVAQP